MTQPENNSRINTGAPAQVSLARGLAGGEHDCEPGKDQRKLDRTSRKDDVSKGEAVGEQEWESKRDTALNKITDQDWREIRLDTCYHEASHAVADVHTGLRLRYVQGWPDPICVSGVSRLDETMKGIEIASGLLAAEWAVYRRRGQDLPIKPFEKFASETEETKETMHHYEDEEMAGCEPDDVRALRLLGLAASWHESLIPVLRTPELAEQDIEPGEVARLATQLEEMREHVERCSTVEGAYEVACEWAVRHLDTHWHEIETVGERLMGVERIEGEEVERLLAGS